MARFIFIYRASGGPSTDPAVLAAWQEFLGTTLGGRVIDPGWPVFEPACPVGTTSAGTRLAGYSVIEADDLPNAIALAQHCPTLSTGGGVDIGTLVELPAEHIAERIRSQI